MKRFKRSLSILLSVAMILQMGITPVFANESTPLGTSTVCPHHVHDESCGYTEAAPCTFDPADCALCTPADSGTAAQVITGFVALDYKTEFQSVPAGTARAALDLPDTLIAHLEGVEGAQPVTGVTWVEDAQRSDPTVYDEAAETGAYVFTPVLPEGCTSAEGFSLPEINVMVGVASPMAAATVGDFTVEGGTEGTDYEFDGSTLTILSGTPLTIHTAAETADRIGVGSGVTANLTLGGVTIKTNNYFMHSFSIPAGAAANVTLEGINSLTATFNPSAGIHVPEGATLTIKGGGTLTVTGGGGAAGIGGSNSGGAGKITIEDGTVIATGGKDGGAGIGGSAGSIGGGDITIKGGAVTATGGSGGGAGIGGGDRGGGGDITIKGGAVTATGGNNGGAGIGGGNNGSGGHITIKGSDVTAIGGSGGFGRGAGIGGGGGTGGGGGNIAISGGNVTVTARSGGAGIGGGGVIAGGTGRTGGGGGNIAISGGNVTVTTRSNSAGIGGGSGDGGTLNGTGGGGGNIAISGGIVTVTATDGNVTISGGTVVTASGTGGAAIGPGYGGASGTLEIIGGSVKVVQDSYVTSMPATRDGAPLKLVTLTLPGVSVVTPLNWLHFLPAFPYGGKDVQTDGEGKLYVWLPDTDAPETVYAVTDSDAFYKKLDGSTAVTLGAFDHTVTTAGELNTALANTTDGEQILVNQSFTIDAGTYIIPTGVTLAIAPEVTLTNSGALKLYGTLIGTGTLAGSGSFTTFGAEDITIPDQYYTGSPITPTPTLSVTRTVMGKEFTVSSSGYTGPVFADNTELGKATATYTYTADPNLTIVKTFNILKSGTEFDGGITTDKTDHTLTYGETITVTVTPKATGTAPAARRTVPTAGQMALFLGDTQITDAKPATNSAPLTFSIDTKDKTLAAGSNTITAKYVGTTSMADYSETVTVTLLPKTIASATVNTGTTKVFDGTAAFTDVALTLNAGDILSGDTVTATAAGDAAGANAGTHSFTATGVTLSGVPGGYYSLAASEVSGNVEITTATPTVKVTAAAKPKSYLRSIIGDHNDTIVLTATTGGANGEKPNGSVVFKNGSETLATVDTTNGVATYDWANPPAGSFTVTAEFTASISETNYIRTAVTGRADAFDISKGAQSALTVHVPALTYGDTGKSLTTSGGSTGGTVSYAITGDCVTVGVDGAITVVKAGTATVTATMPGNSDFNDVTSEAATITVDPAAPTISWGANTAQTVTYTGTAAVVPTPPTVTGIAVDDASNGTITYQHKSTSAKLTNLFGLLEGYTAGLPTDAGEYKIIATVAADGNYKAADSGEMTLTISKITSTLAISSMAGKTYDGTVIANPTNITSNITNPAVTYTYYKDNGSGAKGDKLNDAPKDAGNYWVEGDIAETGNTTAVTSAAVSFTVAQAPLIVTGGTVTQREYDGTTAATVTALIFRGLQNGETLAMSTDYTVGAPAYDSSGAGTSKTVTGTAALIANDKTNNYSLTGGYTITGQIIDKKTGIAAPTGVTMDDTTTAKSFTFGTVSGYADATAYEWKLHTAAAWTAVTANPITFGNRAGNMQIRVKEAANYAAGAIYTHDTAFTATLEGSVSIDGTAAYGETLTAKPTGTQAGAVFHYTWKTSDGSIGTDSADLAIPGVAVGKTITLEVTADGYTGKLISAATTAVAPKQVTAAAGAISKGYDGANAVEAADRTLTIGKVNPSDDITVTMPDAVYNNADAGTGKSITIGNLAITGAAKDWYTVTAPAGVTGEITAKPLNAVTATVNGSYTYNGTAQTPEAADVVVTDGTATFTEGTDYTYTATNHTNAGTAAINVTFKGNYSGTASAAFIIGKAPLTIAGYTAVNKDYDGNTAAAVPAVTFTGLQNGETLALSTDYTVSAQFAKKDAGTDIAVNGTAALSNSDKAKNYSLASGVLSGQSADITAIDPSYTVAAQKIKVNSTLAAIQKLQSTMGVDYETVEGMLTWSATSGGAVLDETFKFEGNAGEVITLYWTFAPTSSNYKVLSGSAAFTLTTKAVPVVAVENILKTYDGMMLTTVSGTAKAGDVIITGTFAFDGAPVMKDAGTYNATVSFTPTDTVKYDTAAISITVIIRKATITIKAKDKSAFVGDAVPAFSETDYTINGLSSGETLKTKPSLTYAATPDMSKEGSVAIIASRAAAPDGGNYNGIVYQPGMLTVSSNNKGGWDFGGIITAPENPKLPVSSETKVSSKTSKNGKAAAAVLEEDITSAIDKAQKEARKNGTGENGIAITIDISTAKNAVSLGVTLPEKSVSELIEADVTALTVKSKLTTVTFDLAALKSMTGGKVVLNSSKMENTALSKNAKAAIGRRPVYQFTVTVDGKSISRFGGQVSVSIPYIRTAKEKSGSLYGVYVNDSGKVTWLTNSSYDSNAKMLRFSTSHFSVYGIGYRKSPVFNDLGTHWAKDDIVFVVSRGLLAGTSGKTFSPDQPMTRGMFVTALGRLAGVSAKKYQNKKFTDVAENAYYAPYVAWASMNGIVSGTGAVTFSPDAAITRQEMAVILVNYSKAADFELPKVYAENIFADNISIDGWAKKAVIQMQMAGVLMSKNGNRFDPDANVTRAEASVMLRRYMELVITRDTKGGWTMNDSGQRMYYENGKPVRGRKTIDGIQYTFDQNGVTADLPGKKKIPVTP